MHRSKSPGDMPFDLHPLHCKARANFSQHDISLFLAIPILRAVKPVSNWTVCESHNGDWDRCSMAPLASATAKKKAPATKVAGARGLVVI